METVPVNRVDYQESNEVKIDGRESNEEISPELKLRQRFEPPQSHRPTEIKLIITNTSES